MSFLQSRYAYADISRPDEWYFCDRCNFRKMKKEANFQFDWRGSKMANLRLLVCPVCLDDPQPQLRTILIGPDPVPVKDARPGFQATEQGFTPVFSVLELVDGDLLPRPTPQPPTPISGTLINNGGVVVSMSLLFPESDAGLAPGMFFSNGGEIDIAVLATTPDPSAPPVFYNTYANDPAGLIALGGANLPLVSGAPNSGQLWNDGGGIGAQGVLSVS